MSSSSVKTPWLFCLRASCWFPAEERLAQSRLQMHCDKLSDEVYDQTDSETWRVCKAGPHCVKSHSLWLRTCFKTLNSCAMYLKKNWTWVFDSHNVLADARPTALLALAPLAVVLADARPDALLALSSYVVVLADAWAATLLATASYSVVLDLLERIIRHTNSLICIKVACDTQPHKPATNTHTHTHTHTHCMHSTGAINTWSVQPWSTIHALTLPYSSPSTSLRFVLAVLHGPSLRNPSRSLTDWDFQHSVREWTEQSL
jgi:hypothetical protein